MFGNDRLRRVEEKIDLLLLYARTQSQKETRMSQQLDDLTTEVQNATTVEQSAITLIQGLAAQLQAAGTDPVKLQALHDQLVSSDQALAAAVAANTQSQPTPAPAPPTT